MSQGADFGISLKLAKTEMSFNSEEGPNIPPSVAGLLEPAGGCRGDLSKEGMS